MKASLKFREEQKPLFRAKVPLNILGFPFQSGIVAGESKELSLNLTTFFESGPSLRIAYRPNDSLNPFRLLFKTGIGYFGSPISSAINMSAEFNLIGGGQNPSFFVHFKPQFGDFTVKKTQSSVFKQPAGTTVGAVVAEDGLVMVDLLDNGKKFAISPMHSPATGVVKGVLSDVELSAKTTVPLRKHAMLNFRWGIKLPATEEPVKMNNNPMPGISFNKFPILIMNKIGIEHVACDDGGASNKSTMDHRDSADGDIATVCLGIKRQLEIIQAENAMLMKAMNDLKSELFAVKSANSTVGGDKNTAELNGNFVRSATEDLKKKKKVSKGTTGV